MVVTINYQAMKKHTFMTGKEPINFIYKAMLSLLFHFFFL